MHHNLRKALPAGCDSITPRMPVDRRSLLLGSIAAVAGLSIVRLDAALAATGPTASLPKQTMGFLEALSDTLIPATDTPGALKAGASAFAQKYLARALAPAEFAQLPGQIELVRQELTRRGKMPFERLKPPERAALLAAFDHEVMAQPTAPAVAAFGSTYARIRAMIILGYYTSEIGMTQELTYLLVPGHYDGDVPFDPKAREYSNGA